VSCFQQVRRDHNASTTRRDQNNDIITTRRDYNNDIILQHRQFLLTWNISGCTSELDKGVSMIKKKKNKRQTIESTLDRKDSRDPWFHICGADCTLLCIKALTSWVSNQQLP